MAREEALGDPEDSKLSIRAVAIISLERSAIMSYNKSGFTARREFLTRAGLIVTGAVLSYPGRVLAEGRPEKKEKDEEKGAAQVSPPEDLMREHGVLRRTLLIYEDIEGRLTSGKEFSPDLLEATAGIIKKFIEDYHEKLEENYLFPRFEKAGKLVNLVHVLRLQHEAGRHLTQFIMKSAATRIERKDLGTSLRMFIRMYRPHAAREDTILFPALHQITSRAEFADLGEEFEDKEQALFGKEGFESVVREVAKLEEKLGIYDLSQFTPRFYAKGKPA
jgi:hemerythrin-like domain-containing protein